MTLARPPLVLGKDTETGEQVTIADIDRYTATYVLGNTGTGKSGFLKTQINQDIAMGNAVIVIDPHGDLANECMAALPPGSVANTFVLDMEDEVYPFGLNIFGEAGTFETDVERSAAIQRIYHIFEILWPEIEHQQYLPTLLKNTTAVFLDNPGHTLYDMMRFFRDPTFRASMLAHVKDRTIQDDFAAEFEIPSLTPKEQKVVVAPLMRRLRSLFIGRGLVRNILGQRATSINFRRAIERHEKIFIKLPTTNLAEDAQVIGMFIMAEITAAIFSFRDIPPDERPGVSLYIDEFQNFVTEDIDRIITEARKFGVRLTIAHQYREQLKGETGSKIKKSTTTVGTKICFRISADNAKEMAEYFPSEGEEALEINPHVTKYLLEQGIDNPYVEEFTDTYIRTLREAGAGKWIEITNEGWNTGKVILGVLPGPAKQEKIKELNPLPFLDKLLYNVMRMGNPELDIPRQIMVGFSNTTYHGFYQQALRARYKPVPDPHLVYDRGDGNPKWLRRPADGTEQFQHFMFYLDQTMRYLATHPIGKTTSSSKAPDIAAMLTQLPNRSAFVRASDEIAAIYTLQLPPMLTGTELDRRMEHIKDQSRAKYASPRSAVDAAITGYTPVATNHETAQQEFHIQVPHYTAPASVPLNRWEDIEE